MENRRGESTTRPEDDTWHAENGTELVGPAKQEIRYDSHGRRRVRSEPLDDGIGESAQGAHVNDGPEHYGTGSGNLRRSENQRLDGSGREAFEEWIEKREMGGGDQYGDGESSGEKLVREIKDGSLRNWLIKGFGLVTFKDEQSMRDVAIEGMNGQDLDECNITVHSSGGGGRSGGGGGYSRRGSGYGGGGLYGGSGGCDRRGRDLAV
ncbi:uncharacterized protein LOC130796647 [Actinidia eriantha]|uniref:uncharacterized protein LOC130796647 n=1 Tax=Actinidia eriantha TaxID=165200 RepID=UPI00258505B5|nr:uncharacterized protein LOC130796647 [Actinidia eriantha]